MTSEPRTEAARSVFDETQGESLGGWVEMSDDDAKALYVAIEDEACAIALSDVEAAVTERMEQFVDPDGRHWVPLGAVLAALREGTKA